MVAMLARLLGIMGLLAIIPLALGTKVVEAQVSIDSIRIETGWGGLGTPQHAIVTIRNDKGVFRRDNAPVDSEAVNALLRALRARTIPRPDLANLGVTPGWLQKNLQAAERRMPARMGDALRSQILLFEGAFTDPEVMAGPVADRFSYSSFDDNPYASVQVLLHDGTKLSATTHSYYAFMIPWTLEGKQTYNAGLSRAASALLPAKTTNKERLAGSGFVEGLADALMQRLQDKWNMLGVEGRAETALTLLRQHYTVLRADINPYHDVYFGRKWEARGPHETNLQAWLHRNELPPNLQEHLVLEFQGGNVEGLDTFLQNAGRYENLVLSIPWLNAWLHDHPEENLTLAYVHDASFGDHAMESFTADMKARGREDLIQPVRAQQKEIALIHTGFVYWLIFPDHHMLLWRFEGPRGFLKWKESDFPAGECDQYYAVNNGGCSGREISPEGQLLPDVQPRDRTCMAAWRREHPIPDPLPEALFSISEGGREGMIDAAGKLILPPCFDGLDDYSEGLARFERDGLWGYVDATGEVEIPPTFPWAEAFHGGLAWVQMRGHALEMDARWGVIDRTGKTVVPPEYTRMTSGEGETDAFHEGLAMVEAQSKSGFPLYGFIDATGKVAIPARFTLASPFSEGIAAVTESGFVGTQQWGFIDKAGNWVIPPQFEWGSDFHGGLAAVRLHSQCGYIDRTGSLVVHPPTPQGEKDCATVWGDFSDGLSRWRCGTKYGYVDRQGRTVIEPTFDLTYGFSEGLAAVRIGDKWGYVDPSGKMVVPLEKVKTADAFHNGLARVTTGQGFGYIDKTGKMVWSGKYE